MCHWIYLEILYERVIQIDSLIDLTYSLAEKQIIIIVIIRLLSDVRDTIILLIEIIKVTSSNVRQEAPYKRVFTNM